MGHFRLSYYLHILCCESILCVDHLFWLVWLLPLTCCLVGHDQHFTSFSFLHSFLSLEQAFKILVHWIRSAILSCVDLASIWILQSQSAFWVRRLVLLALNRPRPSFLLALDFYCFTCLRLLLHCYGTELGQVFQAHSSFDLIAIF